MAIVRRQQINLQATPYYHCTSRCVRKSFLCGVDDYSGNNYEHRRGWIESGLIKLSKAFCIDVVGYAVMPNHYHVILHVNLPQWERLTDHDVIDRYGMIRKIGAEMARYRDGGDVTESEREAIDRTLAQWRDRLSNISCFIGYLNEQIAREGNQEDGCTGRFWEGRFHSQALLDDTALLQCLTYVDLNPIRAGLAETPETGDHTSVKHRIDRRREQQPDELMAFLKPRVQQPSLAPNTQAPQNPQESVIPITFSNYLELLDWTGRILREDKTGAIEASMPPILTRLNTNDIQWKARISNPRLWRSKALGAHSLRKDYAESIGQNWVWQHRPPPEE